MSEQTSGGGIVPAWTLGDRLGRAMREAGVTRTQVAAYLDVDPNTITNYVHNKTVPSRATLLAWAALTGVDLRWLEYGVGGGPQPPGGMTRPVTSLDELTERKRRRARGPAPDDGHTLGVDELVA